MEYTELSFVKTANQGDRMRIRIKSAPSGPVPEWVRQGWVGIELESTGKENINDRDMLVGRMGRQNLGGYQVEGKTAFRALQLHNKEAYDWWVANFPQAAFGILVFHTNVCEELP